jgi:hypothetical protein
MMPRKLFQKPQPGGNLDPQQVEALMRMIQSASGGLAGPSMDLGIQQAKPQGLAAMLGNTAGGGGMGVGGPGGAMAQGGEMAAGAAGMGGLESAMGGPLGAAMGGMLNYNVGMNNKVDDFIASLQGMPTLPHKNPMAQIGKFFDQFTPQAGTHGPHGGHGVGGGGGMKGIGTIGTVTAGVDGDGQDDEGLADAFAEAPAMMGPMAGPQQNAAAMDFSSDPDALAISNPEGRRREGSAAAQSAYMGMSNAGRSAIDGDGPAGGLAAALKGSSIQDGPAVDSGPRQSSTSAAQGDWDKYSSRAAPYGDPSIGLGRRGESLLRARGLAHLNPDIPMPGQGSMAPVTPRMPQQTEYQKSKKRYFGGVGNY